MHPGLRFEPRAIDTVIIFYHTGGVAGTIFNTLKSIAEFATETRSTQRKKEL
jgi:hypothetical protein